MIKISSENLGSADFKIDYGLKYAYLAGAMYKGISSPQLVVKLARAGLIGFLGTGGLSLARIESAIQSIQSQLSMNQPYGMNLLCNFVKPEAEEAIVNLFFKYGIRNIEAAAFIQITPSLVLYRLKGVRRNGQGQIEIPHRILAKVSRPEVAQAFMQPAPVDIVKKLVSSGQLTLEEANLGEQIPLSHDVCVEADSGGHTDQGVAFALMPAIQQLRDELMQTYRYAKPIRVGVAGGIGVPAAAAAAFSLGADFILTGSVNQCTVEAGTSESVKDLLQAMSVQDTAYAPAGDMFELGAKIQVLRKGLFFPARANKLYELYRRYNSLEEIDRKTSEQIQEKYFKRTFAEVWAETKNYYLLENPNEVEKAERNPKHKMALIFRWYFIYSTRLALKGDQEHVVDYQIQCGPALGAFNQWVKGTALEAWRNRHVDKIAEKLMLATADLLTQHYQCWLTQRNINQIQHMCETSY